jgi:adenylate/nucleoside-diphosphate kinase
LKLPKKLPPKKVDIPISNLPIIGYLEQTLATKLNEALKSIGQFKPKYPYVNMDDSASMYMAYYLKGIYKKAISTLTSSFRIANNPKSKDWIRKKYNGKLDLFKTRCELIPYLSEKMGQVVYVPPEKRERIFEDRMQAFFSLGSK